MPGLYTEQSLGFAFLSSQIATDATLLSYAPGGVYRDLAPPNTATPYVIVNEMAATDVLTQQRVRVFTDIVYQIAAWGPASNYAALVNASSRIDAILSRTTGTVSHGIILSCYRDGAIALSEEVAGELWNRLGGLYRIAVQGV